MIAEVTAALAAGAATASTVRSGSPALLRRRLGDACARPLPGVRRRRWLVATATLVAAPAVAFLLTGDRLNLIVLAATGGIVVYAVVALRRRTGRRAVRHRRQTETIEVCDAIVAELNAGIPPPRALSHVASDWPVLAPAARTAELGGDVARALQDLAREPGRAAFGQLGAAWQISVRSGAGLADVLDRLTVALRDEDEARQEVTASLGAPRATARVLAVLPFLGLTLGAGIGGDPVAVLLETMLGAVCLLAGSSLALAGLFWVEHIADTAELT